MTSCIVSPASLNGFIVFAHNYARKTCSVCQFHVHACTYLSPPPQLCLAAAPILLTTPYLRQHPLHLRQHPDSGNEEYDGKDCADEGGGASRQGAAGRCVGGALSHAVRSVAQAAGIRAACSLGSGVGARVPASNAGHQSVGLSISSRRRRSSDQPEGKKMLGEHESLSSHRLSGKMWSGIRGDASKREAAAKCEVPHLDDERSRERRQYQGSGTARSRGDDSGGGKLVAGGEHSAGKEADREEEQVFAGYSFLLEGGFAQFVEDRSSVIALATLIRNAGGRILETCTVKGSSRRPDVDYVVRPVWSGAGGTQRSTDDGRSGAGIDCLDLDSSDWLQPYDHLDGKTREHARLGSFQSAPVVRPEGGSKGGGRRVSSQQGRVVGTAVVSEYWVRKCATIGKLLSVHDIFLHRPLAEYGVRPAAIDQLLECFRGRHICLTGVYGKEKRFYKWFITAVLHARCHYVLAAKKTEYLITKCADATAIEDMENEKIRVARKHNIPIHDLDWLELKVYETLQPTPYASPSPVPVTEESMEGSSMALSASRALPDEMADPGGVSSNQGRRASEEGAGGADGSDGGEATAESEGRVHGVDDDRVEETDEDETCADVAPGAALGICRVIWYLERRCVV